MATDAEQAVIEAAMQVNLACRSIPEKVGFTPEQWAAMECGECTACRLNNAIAALREGEVEHGE